MIFKKFSAFFLCLIVALSMTACNSDVSTYSPSENLTNNEVIEETFNENSEKISDVDLNNVQTTAGSSSAIASETDVSSVSTTIPVSKPSALTKAEIVNVYKKAAQKSHSSVTSEQVITLSDVTINNGEYEGVINFIMPIMSKLLSNNSTETTGITGGYKNLEEADIHSAKTYAVGNNTAVEMVMKNQTDGANSDNLGGSVGHAISTVGNINDVAIQLNDLGLPIEISEENTIIHYTNPTVKVIIDSSGKIIKGTWSYTVEIVLNNYKVGGSTVETTSVVLDNVITVNGGF